MNKKSLKIRKLFLYFVLAFLLVAFSFGIYTLVSGVISLGELDGWDGEEIALDFSLGNGTEDNPYMIEDATEFALFKNIIEGDKYSAYQDKYYALGNDIDLNGKSITPIGIQTEEEEHIFKGHLDGRGHTLHNFKITSPSVVGDVSYYSLFSKVEDASITSLAVEDYQITVEEDVSNAVVSPFIGEVVGEEDEEFKNIILQSFFIDAKKASFEDSIISSYIGGTVPNILHKNIIIVGTIDGNDTIESLSLTDSEDFSFYNFIVNVDVFNSKVENVSTEDVENIYHFTKNGFIEEVSYEEVFRNFNEELIDFYFDISDNQFVFRQYEVIIEDIPESSKSFTFSVQRASNITLHDSGAVGNTVYINDLDSDLNYYHGLNYTESTTGTWPSGTSSNTYNESNLSKVYIAYEGYSPFETSVIGYVSLEEVYSTIIYYKYYPIVDGYVTIPLIDNPFADRPNNRAFNGWITDYEGAIVTLDTDTYIRYVKIPAESEISITMYATWTEATVVNSATNANLKAVGMRPIANGIFYIYDVPTLYSRKTINSGTGANGTAYPTGSYDQNGNSLNGQRCRRVNYQSVTCTYYTIVDESTISEGQSYYQLLNGEMSTYVVPPHVGAYLDSAFMDIGYNASGYFKKVRVNGSLVGYYNSTGVLQTTGTCNGGTSCDYYELLQYSESNVITEDNYTDIFYLVTRDTNIVYLTSNINGFTNTKPLTVTGINNNVDHSNYQVNISSSMINANADLRIEYCNLYTGVIPANTSGPSYTNNGTNSYFIYGNFYNLKIGRGIPITEGSYTTGSWWNPETHEGKYFNARGVVGGRNNSTGSNASPTKYTFIIESGNYNYISAVGTTSSSATYVVNGISTYGNDIDRVLHDNDKMNVNYNVASTYGGTVSGGSYTTKFMTTYIKSGTYGEDSSEAAYGVYVGGLNGGTINSPAELIMEGGKALYINGGPLVSTNMTNYNAIYFNMKGGEADCVFGGAARTETYGNRILNITDGVVRYGVFGGSNGILGNNNSNSRGTLSGKTFVHIGGNATIGDADDTVFGIEPGSVFGAGNGNSQYSTIGSVNDSKIVIDGTATINGNVYGGGNYGAVVAQSGNTSTSTITIKGATIKGSVYGGGNNNGSGSTSVTSTIQINVDDGTILNSVYGGSRTKGTVYGNTNVIVNGGNIHTDVYGGGEGGYTSSAIPGTYVRDNVNVVVNNGTIQGNVYGGSAFGTVNAINQTTNTSSATTKVTVNNGVVQGSVFGGAKGSSEFTPRVVGDITVTVDGGSIGKVFGGMDASGKPSNGDVVYLNGGTIGDAFGGGNNANQDTTDIRLQGSTITGNLYGGSNLLGTVTTSNVTMTSGSVTDIYGGNNLDGMTITTNVSVSGGTVNGDIYGGGNEAPSTTSNVTVQNVSVHDVYGGGKEAGLTTSNVSLTSSQAGKVFGGSNVSGQVNESNVHVAFSTLNSLYGGNNQGGSTTDTHVDTSSSTITNVFGGGDNAVTGVSDVKILSGNITNVYGGGNEAGLTTSNVEILGGVITNVFGGSNKSGNIDTSNVVIGKEKTYDVNIEYTKRAPGYYPQSTKPTYAEITVTLTNLTDEAISDWEVHLDIPSSEIYSNYSNSNITVNGNTYSVNAVNRYSGMNTLAANGGTYSFQFAVLSDSPLEQFDVSSSDGDNSSISIGTVYGGNNLGGITNHTNIDGNAGVIQTIYGGGNQASVSETNVVLDSVQCGDVYGGGNAAGVSGDTFLDIDRSVITNNVYGGGNEGIVEGSTEVLITDTHVEGNAFAGGNGSTAVVYHNSVITIDGESEIGTDSSVAPNDGCVFGSGNAASTGLASVNNSQAIVNIVGGVIHGNVYGGPKMAVVYGTTDTNIGSAAVSNNDLVEGDVIISGTVFGGGESNASGSETYDWTFISVTKGIDVLIDGSGYNSHNHKFILNGSIFGSGNASSSSGDSSITIRNLGTNDAPNKNISIQRANSLVIDSSFIELEGTTDRTNEYSDILYSFNIIDKLIIKNGTTLLLQHNANLLKELYSGVDSDGSLVPAVVDIDEDSKTVTKNVDNRIYMLPGQNLNITINQAATAYGKVTGMTFFGMYNSFEGGTYRYGLYDRSYDYGDSGNAGLEIVGGSYVIGLRNVDHDITKDGFYSNYLDEDTYSEIVVDYIDPSEIGTTGYRWIIGFEAINYEFTLTASKYSSLGTYELQLIDFADGNTTFNVLGFDSSGLNSEIRLVDSTEVPRVGKTEEEANNILGLSMKSETQEWTGYGTTKMLSNNGGEYTGDREYRTDSRSIPPSFMFYLYHAKNISSEGKLGSTVLTLQAAIPKNAIEYDIKFVTITIHLVARKYDDADCYDASITYDRRYEMPSSTSVNITNQSQFSTFYSFIAMNDKFENVYGKNNEYFHVLVTNYALPVNTMITMLDYSSNTNRPEYYYFTVTQDVYNESVQQLSQYNEITYRLSDFVKMNSTTGTNTYHDAVANLSYYDEETGLVDEEFMFIFDFKECNVTGEHLNNTMLFELRNSEDRTVYNVLGIREALMVYNTFESSNVVLKQTFTDNDSYLYYNIPDEFNYSTQIQYNETENRQSVIDTNYESSSMGLNIVFLDKDLEQVSSSLLIGTSFKIDNREYFADGDGVFRIKLANKVSNLQRDASLMINTDLPAGEYTIRYTLFASDDGLHNSSFENSVTQEFVVNVVSADNSIMVECDDPIKVVDGDTGLNMDGRKTNSYKVIYEAALTNPNFRLEIYKRSTSTIDTTTYESVPFNQLFKTSLSVVRGNEVAISMDGLNEKTFIYELQDDLVSGTYKVVFKLYDQNQLIDDDVKYVIVKKKSE